ncbi:MAG: hypothetical protein JWM80_3885 [Cyanobacteria bacterium RYN_339]|nr:hypothetical protein [Cyanobacteria bacterium RYN_339]
MLKTGLRPASRAPSAPFNIARDHEGLAKRWGAPASAPLVAFFIAVALIGFLALHREHLAVTGIHDHFLIADMHRVDEEAVFLF